MKELLMRAGQGVLSFADPKSRVEHLPSLEMCRSHWPGFVFIANKINSHACTHGLLTHDRTGHRAVRRRLGFFETKPLTMRFDCGNTTVSSLLVFYVQ